MVVTHGSGALGFVSPVPRACAVHPTGVRIDVHSASTSSTAKDATPTGASRTRHSCTKTVESMDVGRLSVRGLWAMSVFQTVALVALVCVSATTHVLHSSVSGAS